MKLERGGVLKKPFMGVVFMFFTMGASIRRTPSLKGTLGLAVLSSFCLTLGTDIMWMKYFNSFHFSWEISTEISWHFCFSFLLPQISVDVTEVEFGSQVLGETRRRIINVTNNGALGTEFIFKKITGIRWCFRKMRGVTCSVTSCTLLVDSTFCITAYKTVMYSSVTGCKLDNIFVQPNVKFCCVWGYTNGIIFLETGGGKLGIKWNHFCYHNVTVKYSNISFVQVNEIKCNSKVKESLA